MLEQLIAIQNNTSHKRVVNVYKGVNVTIVIYANKSEYEQTCSE